MNLRPNDDKNEFSATVHKPRPKEFMKKIDCGDSIKGLVCGIAVLLVAVVDLLLFFGFDYHAETKVNTSDYLYSKL